MDVRLQRTSSRKRYNRLLEVGMESNLPNARAVAMRLFALAPWPIFDALTDTHSAEDYTVLRGPETGLVMLRGRMGSTGNAFNFGAATVTRCTLSLPSGIEGHAYVMGGNAEHSKRAALCDALYQAAPEQMASILSAIDSHLASSHQAMAAKAAATKVDFFTMVRGDV